MFPSKQLVRSFYIWTDIFSSFYNDYSSPCTVSLSQYCCFLAIINTEQFVQLKNPTGSLEGKIQRIFQKINQSLLIDVYAQFYRTGSSPDRFYGTKVHKLTINGIVEELPLLHITSNLNTTTYQLAHYLAKTLSALSRSQYVINL